MEEDFIIMVPNPLFYQLLMVALILICLLIHVGESVIKIVISSMW